MVDAKSKHFLKFLIKRTETEKKRGGERVERHEVRWKLSKRRKEERERGGKGNALHSFSAEKEKVCVSEVIKWKKETDSWDELENERRDK